MALLVRVMTEPITEGGRHSDRTLTILLFTRDCTFDGAVGSALEGTRADMVIARTVADAIRIVCEPGRALDLAVMDFDDSCRGMTLLSAVHTCCAELPVLVTASTDEQHVQAVAYANGARVCFDRSFTVEAVTGALAALSEAHPELLAA